MLMEICALAAGASARPVSNAAVESNVVSPRMCDPLKVSTILRLRGTLYVAVKKDPATAATIRILELCMKPRMSGECQSVLTSLR